MKVIATAGHVDHGKSALVQALTGVHPDRLREEQERGMTIDLGFAWMTLPDATAGGGSEMVGIVDVPGHIDFIKNMLAGVGGVDAALFVVAADEGVMPQTREHLDILDLLDIPRGVIALTKSDLVDDPDWLELVREEVASVLKPTSLAAAPILPVSAHTRQGLPDLIRALTAVLAAAPDRPDLGRPRLPIDRVFTIAGFGTIVTGTLLDGSLRVGDEVVVLPGDLRARIRGLQTHKTRLDVARPGSRVAVNLSGLHPDQLHRGQVLTFPGLLRPTLRVDVRLRALVGAPAPLEHGLAIAFHSGAAESPGRLRLLENDALAPGHSAWAQIELEHPLVLARNDHFILRRPSPSNTLGGGLVADPTPRRQHRRRRPEVFAQLETLLRGSPADLLEAAIGQQGPLAADLALAAAKVPADQAPVLLAGLLAAGRVQQLEPGDPNSPLITPTGWASLRGRIQDMLRAFHQANPLRLGMPREEMRARVQPKSGWSAKVFNGVIARAVAEAVVVERSALLSSPAFSPRFSPAQQAAVDKLLASFRAAPYNSPSSKQCLEVVSDEVFDALLEQGILVRVAPDVVFDRAAYDVLLAGVRETIQARGQITVGDLRDRFETSRKYALALLEHLDAIRITRREGDVRTLR